MRLSVVRYAVNVGVVHIVDVIVVVFVFVVVIIVFFLLCAQGTATVMAGKAVGHRQRSGLYGEEEGRANGSGGSLVEQGGRKRMVRSLLIIVNFVNRK